MPDGAEFWNIVAGLRRKARCEVSLPLLPMRLLPVVTMSAAEMPSKHWPKAQLDESPRERSAHMVSAVPTRSAASSFDRCSVAMR